MNTWGIELLGDKQDKEVALQCLKSGFDPFVEYWNDFGEVILVLRSAAFTHLDDTVVVLTRGQGLLRLINGAMRIEHRAQALIAGNVLKMNIGGVGFQRFAIAVGTARGRSDTSSASGTVGGVDPASPQASAVQNQISLAERSDLFADMLTFAGDLNSWFSIYMLCEAAEKLSGGIHELRKDLGSDKREFNELRSTANFNRHAYPGPVPKLITLEEAQTRCEWLMRFVHQQYFNSDVDLAVTTDPAN